MSYSLPGPASSPPERPPSWEGVVFEHRDRIPLRLWAKACCANPTPVLQSDHKNRPIVMCANCGART